MAIGVPLPRRRCLYHFRPRLASTTQPVCRVPPQPEGLAFALPHFNQAVARQEKWKPANGRWRLTFRKAVLPRLASPPRCGRSSAGYGTPTVDDGLLPFRKRFASPTSALRLASAILTATAPAAARRPRFRTSPLQSSRGEQARKRTPQATGSTVARSTSTNAAIFKQRLVRLAHCLPPCEIKERATPHSGRWRVPHCKARLRQAVGPRPLAHLARRFYLRLASTTMPRRLPFPVGPEQRDSSSNASSTRGKPAGACSSNASSACPAVSLNAAERANPTKRTLAIDVLP